MLPTCPGDTAAQVAVNSSGCPCMFSACIFDWDTGDSTKTAYNLAPGWHTVTITHLNGCLLIDSVEIPDGAPVFTDVITTDISCASSGINDGSVQVVLTDPANSNVKWTHQVSGSSLNSLAAGTYSALVSDIVRGCEDSVYVTINMPDTLWGAGIVTDVNCFGDSTGSIIGTAVGGYPPYTFAWSTSQQTDTINGLDTGYYHMLVTDSALLYRYCI